MFISHLYQSYLSAILKAVSTSIW